MDESLQKLEKVYNQLKSIVPAENLRISPCSSSSEAVAYRCKCSFQLVRGPEDSFSYAVRKEGQPIVIHEFQIASTRIQRAMKDVLVMLNAKTETAITDGLSSVSFASSWSDERDCGVTFNYYQPIRDIQLWMKQARTICLEANLSQATGRSRGAHVQAYPHAPVLRDQIALIKPTNGSWFVRLIEPSTDTQAETIVEYEKPECAFFHPNTKAMLRALEWQLHQISSIAEELAPRKPKLLELYCGCGAHTMALAKSGLLESVVAVELDHRLVESCRRNIQLNHLDNVMIVSEDAGTWAQRNKALECDVILVDPPRQGLAESVCRMIVATTSCEHMLYISCGHQALVRDLKLLSKAFDVAECNVIDLFPSMEGVESLVHLRRKGG